MMDYTDHRRLTGLILGLVLGVGYSLSANLANRIILPNIPLYSPPPGDYGVFVAMALMFGLLGLVAAWGDEPFPSIVNSGLTGTLLSWAWALVYESSNVVGMLALLIYVFPSVMLLYLPFGALVRWLISKLDPLIPTPVTFIRKVMPVVYSFVALIALGTFEILPKETRLSLVRMQDLLKTGMQTEVTSFKDLPKPLQPVEGFMSKANGKYTLTVGSDPDVLPVQRPIVDYRAREPFIIIRFENGFRFGCVFSPPYDNPACIDF